jgi:uncharacterized membrane protein (UPF0182 family)
LKAALDQVFGGNSGTTLNNTGSTISNTTTSSTQSSSVKSALAAAQSALSDSQSALKQGDFTAYGKAQARLKSAISDAIKAQAAGK